MGCLILSDFRNVNLDVTPVEWLLSAAGTICASPWGNKRSREARVAVGLGPLARVGGRNAAQTARRILTTCTGTRRRSLGLVAGTPALRRPADGSVRLGHALGSVQGLRTGRALGEGLSGSNHLAGSDGRERVPAQRPGDGERLSWVGCWAIGLNGRRGW